VEYEFLEHAQSIPGVDHMISYEQGRCETKQFRCSTTTGQYYNRIATRIVLKSYGRSIVSFTNILQVISAIRDAIAGRFYYPGLITCSILIPSRQVISDSLVLALKLSIEISHPITFSLV
jgi:hypothetical protein